MRSLVFRLVVLSCASVVAAATHAEEIPPIKPGLWQIHSERAVDGQKAAPVGDRIKNLPPEVRKQMEAMMKQRGVDMSAASGGDFKICLSRDSLSQDQWLGQRAGSGNCKTDYTSRGNRRWSWRSVCAQPKSETDGEAVFDGPEHYTIKLATRMDLHGESRTTNMTNTSTWLGPDCGSLKPINAKTLGAPVSSAGDKGRK